MKAILIKVPALVIVLGIWVLSSQSTLPQPKGILGFDKVQHLIAYLVLAVTIGFCPSRRHWQTRRLLTALIVAAIASVYGVIDEVHQSFVPGRDCNIWDWLADTIGAALGAGTMLLVNRLLVSFSKTSQ